MIEPIHNFLFHLFIILKKFSIYYKLKNTISTCCEGITIWLTVDGPATVLPLIDNCRPTVGSTEPIVTEAVLILFAVSTMGVDTAIRFAVPVVVKGLLDWAG